MIKIMIADDHSIVREGIKQVLVEEPDMIVADEACNGEEALDKALNNDFDVIVLDISMPGRGGLDALKQIKKYKPELPVLVLSIHPEELYAFRVLKAGASGYMTKDSAPDELVNALKKVLQGKKYVSTHLAEELALALETDSGRPIQEKLSDREFQVMCMIASGKMTKKIADVLSVSVKTVSVHRSHILKKMRLKNNAEITNYVLRNNLLQ